MYNVKHIQYMALCAMYSLHIIYWTILCTQNLVHKICVGQYTVIFEPEDCVLLCTVSEVEQEGGGRVD